MGFIRDETNQWAQAVYRNTVPIEPEHTTEEGYHFGEDVTDNWLDITLRFDVDVQEVRKVRG